MCVSFPPYIPNNSRCSFHKFIPLSIRRPSSFFLPLYLRPHLCLPVCCLLCLSLSGIQVPELLSLWPMTSQVTSSLFLTFRVRTALGKRQWTDLPIQGMVELQGGQQGLAIASLSHELSLYSGIVVI